MKDILDNEPTSPNLKGGGHGKINIDFFVPMFSLGNAKTKTKIFKIH